MRPDVKLRAVPLVPELRLELAGTGTGLWDGGTDRPAPFWAFAWAGGIGLARYVLDHPDLVRGRRVLDIGAGSGIVALAAARAGAAHVTAADIDPDAVAAIGRNAAANRVEVTASAADPLLGAGDGIEVILVGDAFYSPRIAHRMMRFFRRARVHDPAVRVVVSDPNRGYLVPDRFDELAAYDVPVPDRLEGTDSMCATIWSLAPAAPSGQSALAS